MAYDVFTEFKGASYRVGAVRNIRGAWWFVSALPHVAASRKGHATPQAAIARFPTYTLQERAPRA